MISKKVLKENVILRVGLSVAITIIVGLGLIILSNFLKEKGVPEIWVSIVRDLASLFIGSTALSIVWEFYTKRSLIAEFLYSNTISHDIGKTGVTGITDRWNGVIDWPSELDQTNNIFVFFIYGSTWSKTNNSSITKFAQNPRNNATFVFPNPNNHLIMESLAFRLETPEDRPTPEEMGEKINRSIQEIKAIFKMAPEKNLQIVLADVIPVYSYYEMDNKVIIAFYKHKKSRDDVPHMVLNKSGTLFKYFSNDISEMLNSPLSNKHQIFP